MVPSVQSALRMDKQGDRRRSSSGCGNSSLDYDCPSGWDGRAHEMNWTSRMAEAEMSGAPASGTHGCCDAGDGLSPPWMDWVESGIEFFGCEGDLNSRSVIGRALMLRKDAPTGNATAAPAPDQDFVRLHEEFFESLLKEQVQRADQGLASGSVAHPSTASSADGTASVASTRATASTGTPPTSLKHSHSKDDSIGTCVSSVSSCTFQTNSTANTATHKRRRPLRLAPRMSRPSKVAPLEAYDLKYNPALKKPPTPAAPLSPDQLSLDSILSKSHLLTPESYLHHNCVLQKDKGKGDPLGSNISARGQQACLDKLREKIFLVVKVSGKDQKAGIKRRPAKIAARTATYVETRSMIELRLGFLSMQYGLLLQWEQSSSNKIVLIALRKMCHDSFYTSLPELSGNDIAHIPRGPSLQTQLAASPPLVVRSVNGNNAIYQRMQGTEVVFVDPPFRVPQPDLFLPSVLKVQVRSLVGLNKRKRWTLSFRFNGHTELAHMHFNADLKQFEFRRDPMTWELPVNTTLDVANLEIRILEQEKRKYSTSKLASTVTLPLGGLVNQPSVSAATSWQVTLPFKHDKQQANLTLALNYQSDYAYWLYQELSTRRSEEISAFRWDAPFIGSPNDHPDGTSRSSHSFQNPLDWLCGICFKEFYI